ncbi:glycoside hydrolase family 16 protein [Pterulicium gracile]|uniref:Glycoside hydrolase family 16 protein n=1 Tax=Pterulicium gracile TaxID=1884261 RepID=A0A5C3QFH6_9AGAR|nr:glycoside hydrolase family 16 protein [Pterula gracilis]
MTSLERGPPSSLLWQLVLQIYLAVLYAGLAVKQVEAYDLVREYSGIPFFDRWDFYGSWDNLTSGDVWWLNRDDAYSQRLAYINDAGNAVLKVDNTGNVPFNEKRNSIRITSMDSYAVGSLWVIDLMHLPYGCSVWPAFWTKGPNWPDDGEIDIIEGINLQANNQMALHTTPGCMHTTPPNQMGVSGELDCSTPAGCVVGERFPNSYGPGFGENGGGVWATQFDVSGIFIWYWSRKDVPKSIQQATSKSSLDVSDFGPPSASYIADACNITEFFSPQNIVIDITLCGIWASLQNFYAPQCASAGETGLCYNDNVVGDGSNYDNAYFEISYLRAYTTGGVAPTPTAAAFMIPTPAESTATWVQADSTEAPWHSGGAVGVNAMGGGLLWVVVVAGVSLGVRSAL